MFPLLPRALPLRDPFTNNSSLSAIEARFPRIARELSGIWNTSFCEDYLSKLLIHTRVDRDGFPADVQEELMFLSSLQWHLQHPAMKTEEETKPEGFSFSALNEMELRHAGTRGAWIL